jgi:hypothetical protein
MCVYCQLDELIYILVYDGSVSEPSGLSYLDILVGQSERNTFESSPEHDLFLI